MGEEEVKVAHILKPTGDRKFSAYVKFSEKLTFIILYARVRVRISGWKMLAFHKMLRTC